MNSKPLRRWLAFSVSVALVSGGLQPAQALISQPTVVVEVTGPKRATVQWDVPSEAGEDGDKTVAVWQLDLADNFSFNDVTTKSYAAEVLLAELTGEDGLHSIDQFYVRVKAVYTDDTDSNYGSTNFYTAIGKLKNLRVTNKDQDSVTLKWDKPPRQADSLHYDVQVYKQPINKSKKLVFDDSVYGKNTVTITGLKPGQVRYYFRVRGRHDSKYGTGKWSSKKYFRTDSS